MKLARNASALALATLMGVAAPVAVMAQAQQSLPPAEDVSGDDIDAFVIAYESVVEIEEKFAAQMAQTEDQAQRQILQEEAQIEKTEAVEQTPGMDVDRYIEILSIAQADPDLSARIVDRLSE